MKNERHHEPATGQYAQLHEGIVSFIQAILAIAGTMAAAFSLAGLGLWIWLHK